jgi:hypothetical protein
MISIQISQNLSNAGKNFALTLIAQLWKALVLLSVIIFENKIKWYCFLPAVEQSCPYFVNYKKPPSDRMDFLFGMDMGCTKPCFIS